MGNTTSVPSGKNYIISYCKHSKFKSIPDISNKTNLVNGIGINNKTHTHLIYSVFYYFINNNGYSLKKMYPHGTTTNLSLECLLKGIITKGFYSADYQKKLSDIIITPICYTPKLKTIRSLVYLGNVLIAGLIIDSYLSQLLFKVDVKQVVTEIVLVIGYNEKELLVKSIWDSEIISIPNEYISNIKEVWNIEINSPEDKFFDEKNKIDI